MSEADLRGGRGPGSHLLLKKFGCLYRESLKRDWSGPPLRSVSGHPLMKISGSATACDVFELLICYFLFEFLSLFLSFYLQHQMRIFDIDISSVMTGLTVCFIFFPKIFENLLPYSNIEELIKHNKDLKYMKIRTWNKSFA